MISQIQYNLLDNSESTFWDNYVVLNNGSFYHKYKWKALIENLYGHRGYYCVAKHNDKIVGILPLININSRIFGNYLISVPYFNYGGVIANSEEVERGLLNYSNQLRHQLGCKHSEIRMDKALQVDNNGLVNGCRTDKVTMLLDLPDDPDHLWRAIGSKRRSQIKRPIREGVSFRLGHSELLNDFYKVFSLNMRDLGTPVYGKEFFEAILAAFTDETQVAVVYLEGTPVGGAFLLNHNGTMEIPWASTDRRFNRYGINMFMYWNILESAIKQGIQTFDFGRSSIESGTLKFKKQWGAKPKQLFWYYQLDSEKPIPQLNHSNKKLRLFIQAWKKLPLFIANRLGPFIVKDLP